MNIALIKNQVCKNVAVFDNLESARDMLGKVYDFVTECPNDRAVNHRYINNTWFNPQPQKDQNGIYPYIKDMNVLIGDKVLDLNGIVYESLENINLQQEPPSKMKSRYKELIDCY